MARKLKSKRSIRKSQPVHVQEKAQEEILDASQPQGSQEMEANRLKLDEVEIRSTSLDMLRKALTYGDIPEGARNAEKLSKATEAKLFEVHRGTNVSYKAAVRRLVFNLRRNQDLRANVLTGSILPEKFAVMTSQEMASAEMKKIREKFTLEGILEHQKANETGTPTDLFRCEKCGQNNCTYTQAQTRSADEPMTTFVFCRECGNRWKSS